MKAHRCRAIMERAAVVLALVMGIVTDQRAGDQGIFVQNTGTTDANVLIEYKSGESEQVSGLPPMGSAYFPTASWQGSAVVSADQPVAAIAVLTGPDGTGTAFPPSHALGTQFSYPFFDHTTGVCLQNPGPAPANVTIDFLNAEGQSNHQSVVPAGDTLLLAGGSVFPALNQPFAGSAVLSSDQPVSSIAFHQMSSGATRFSQSMPEHVAVMPGFAGSGVVALSGTEGGTVSMSTWDQDGTQGTPFSVDLTVGEWAALPPPPGWVSGKCNAICDGACCRRLLDRMEWASGPDSGDELLLCPQQTVGALGEPRTFGPPEYPVRCPEPQLYRRRDRYLLLSCRCPGGETCYCCNCGICPGTDHGAGQWDDSG